MTQKKDGKIQFFWKVQCLVEEGWHLATLFFLERLGVACLRRPMLQCKQDCLMHCHPLLFVQCLESPVGKRKRSMTVSTSQDPSFSGLNQVWTVSYSNLNPKFMCFIFCFGSLFFVWFIFCFLFCFSGECRPCKSTSYVGIIQTYLANM